MEFVMNMPAVWALEIVLLALVIKVGIKVIQVLTGRDPDIFDMRKLPDFLAADVLPEVGGLLILAIVMFLKPAEEMPDLFKGILTGLQVAWYVAAGALAGKYAAKITDKLPKPPAEATTAALPASPAPGTVAPDPGSASPTNPPGTGGTG